MGDGIEYLILGAILLVGPILCLPYLRYGHDPVVKILLVPTVLMDIFIIAGLLGYLD